MREPHGVTPGRLCHFLQNGLASVNGRGERPLASCGIVANRCASPGQERNLFSPEPVSPSLTVKQELRMSVAKVIEITSLSKKSFEDAITEGIKRAGKTVSNIEGAWIKEQKVQIKDGKIVGFRVNMNLTFILDD